MPKKIWIEIPSTKHEVDVEPNDFVYHGNWMDGNRIVARMYVHIDTGDMFYEDVKEARDRGLGIYPF